MTASEYIFGGNGIKERDEYSALEGEALKAASEQATSLADALLNRAYIDDTATHHTLADDGKIVREAELTYLEPPRPDDSFMVFDTEQEKIVTYDQPDINYRTDVMVTHQNFSDEALQESYTIRFDRQLPYTKGFSATKFTFELCIEKFAGGHISAVVTGNNIDVEDGIEGSFYTRAATPYDMTQFQREAEAMLSYKIPSLVE